MNALRIMVLLHHSRNNEPITWEGYDPSLLADAHIYLNDNEFIKPKDFGVVTKSNFQDTDYNVTEKGRVFINALISLPDPVQAFRMPIPQ